MRKSSLLDEVQVRRHTLEMVVCRNKRARISKSINANRPLLTETSNIDMKQLAKDESIE